MKCPCCRAAELISDTRDLPYTYKGETTTLPAVTGEYCPACGEVVLNREHGDRYGELIGLYQRQINAAYVDPDYIARVRKKLDLDQREAGEKRRAEQRTWLKAALQKGLDAKSTGPVDMQEVIRRGRARLAARKRRRS